MDHTTEQAAAESAASPWVRAGEAVSQELAAGGAEQLRRPRVTGRVLVSAHAGSGSSTWAQLLDATELPREVAGRGYVIVARTTLRGIEAAKFLTPRAAAVLLVADAPGRPSAEVRRQIKVLSGASHIVTVPWVPSLRGMDTITESSTLRRAVAKVAAAIEPHWKGPRA